MKLRRRSLIVWLLYGCILLSTWACSFGHGTPTGSPPGIEGGLHSLAAGHHAGPSPKGSVSDPAEKGLATFASCPFSASVSLIDLALLFSLAGLLRPARYRRRAVAQRCKSPPRFTWPSANPRASPDLLA